MHKAVCDTSALIKLSKGQVLDCLAGLFDKVCIPRGVEEECRNPVLANEIRKPFFEIRAVRNILPIGMGKGEREAISLALELNLKIIVNDDIKAFRKADRLNLSPLTSENILILAKRANLISSVRFVLDTMRNAGEGIEDDVYSETLRSAGELI